MKLWQMPEICQSPMPAHDRINIDPLHMAVRLVGDRPNGTFSYGVGPVKIHGGRSRLLHKMDRSQTPSHNNL